MTSGGWGKKAANRIDRTQFDNDELLKSLGTQFNVDFTGYDQWQRTNKVVRPLARPSPSGDQAAGFTIGRIKSADSCKHTSYRDKKQAAKLEELQKQRSERIKVLELRIRTRKKTLQEYQKRFKELLEENIKLKSGIDAEEKTTHDQVKGLLRRYEKYRGGISTLNTNFVKELADAMKELEDVRERIQKDFTVLEKRVAEMDLKLRSKQEELNILNSYKDKEYPVKAMQIANLRKEIENLKVSHTEDQDELVHIVNTEIGKYQKERIQVANDITKTITERSVALMHPSLKDMALQNMVMSKEIEFHLKEQEEIDKINQALEIEVDRLLRDPKTNARLQMFPEFFPVRQKCTPDMEVILDIPTQEWLPI